MAFGHTRYLANANVATTPVSRATPQLAFATIASLPDGESGARTNWRSEANTHRGVGAVFRAVVDTWVFALFSAYAEGICVPITVPYQLPTTNYQLFCKKKRLTLAAGCATIAPIFWVWGNYALKSP
jgi:hypothetical protein